MKVKAWETRESKNAIAFIASQIHMRLDKTTLFDPSVKKLSRRQDENVGLSLGKALAFTSRRRSKKAFATAASPVNNVRYSSWK